MSARGIVLGVLLAGLFLDGARLSGHAQALAVADLLRMSEPELDALYRRSPPAPMPPGRVRGTVLLRTGTNLARPLAAGARAVWQGKRFDPAESSATNRFFGLPVVSAQVSSGPSWLDGGPALILDYSQTSLVYARYRDEIRQVAPGLFLGRMYDRATSPPALKMVFALESRP
jgi:hypothetical protein